MKALVYTDPGEALQFGDYPDPTPGEGEVLVQLRAAALNHRDVFITQGLYPNIRTPSVLGSDGAGMYNGREVIINPGTGWGDNPAYPSRNYQVLGMPIDGTFAQCVLVSSDRLAPKPAHLSWEQAAALPLGGLTAYRALFTKARLQSGQRVLVTGIGGGVALMTAQLALAAGAEVWVTSGSAEKLQRAIKLGISGGVNYRDADWQKQLSALAVDFDVIVDSAGGEAFAHLVRLCRPGGCIVVYGGGKGLATFSPQYLFWRQISIHGTSMGADQEFQNMVDFVAQHRITPVIDSVYALPDGNNAFQRMDRGLQFGKIVFSIPQ
ncbi:MAG: zinc-binding dehydrogenase [Saprospiraceae bacterium]|jgi:NADPH:quinone reductase-like Zn-dependent oxidoreductase|nr:zinc-binding dehydrogenase [Saprospiraceae bacterium]